MGKPCRTGFQGAYRKGYLARRADQPLTSNPYPDRLKADGGNTFSRAWGRAWDRGWNDAWADLNYPHTAQRMGDPGERTAVHDLTSAV